MSFLGGSVCLERRLTQTASLHILLGHQAGLQFWGDCVIGKQVSHYRILEKLGSGGMGVVYRAEDLKLQRTVALKFLRPDALLSPQDRARFTYEARAASALEHSNICSIFEIDETEDGQMFICMPCYEGATLREKIAAGPLKIPEAIDIAIQLAEGLQEAHDKGIVHRDIKSGNIIVTDKGQVKIMDFGLAKTDRTTRLTSTGVTLGTVAYMSPEQARGDKTTHVTDIWSAGVVLYEMIAGHLPFQADLDQAAMYMILNQEPEPLTAIRTGVPMELERITNKAMAKRPEERYQSARELVADLTALRRRMESEKPPTAAQTPTVAARKRFRRRTISVALVVLVVIAATTVYFGTRRERPIPQARPFQVTGADAWQSEPVLSPDGSRIAYISDESGNPDLYVVGVHGGNPLRLTDDPHIESSPAWFPDGSSIAFVSERGGTESVWKTGELGGSPTLLLADASYPSISPDGKRIAFSRKDAKGQRRIATAALSAPENVKVLTGDSDGLWNHIDAAWSPDGQYICYSARHNLWIVPSDGGKARRLTTDDALDCEPAWSPDGRYIYFCSYREETVALWRVASRGGRPERVTMGSARECSPSICSSGMRLAYATRTGKPYPVIRDTESGKDAQLPNLEGSFMASIAPDASSIVFSSDRWGSNTDLWLQPMSGTSQNGAPVRLTDHAGIASQPAFSPDGKWVAYYRITGKERDIWVVPVGGGQPARFSEDAAPDYHPAWSPDGSMLAFVSSREGRPEIWVAPFSEGRRTGPPKKINTDNMSALAPSWSPDGKSIAFLGSHKDADEVFLVPLDGSSEIMPVTTNCYALRVHWNAWKTSDRLLVSGTWGESQYTLRTVSLDGRRVEPFEPPIQFGTGPDVAAVFDVSADGRFIVYAKADPKGDVWVLESKKLQY